MRQAAEPEPEWAHSALETVEAHQFYNAVGRTGIKYGPHFRMVQRTNISADTSALLRCAAPSPRVQHGVRRAGVWECPGAVCPMRAYPIADTAAWACGAFRAPRPLASAWHGVPPMGAAAQRRRAPHCDPLRSSQPCMCRR